jgi:hypothetical protein
MLQKAFILVLFLCTNLAFGQDVQKEYSKLISAADSLYNLKNYKIASENYSEAFELFGSKIKLRDRYNAACNWSLASNPDSAFSQLNILTDQFNYKNYNQIANDPDLKTLQSDKRWNLLIEKIKANKSKAEANLNKPLVAILDTIMVSDQKYRLEFSKLNEKYGWNSKEVKSLMKIMAEQDAANKLIVTAILDQYGWLGKEEIGEEGNSTLFLVIQHADHTTQLKYLPMMREAVKNGKAESSGLALLEDRVALGQQKRQIYGSQVEQDPITQAYIVSPLEDPDNVDKRRAEVGLEPLSTYLSYFKIKWDVEQYKKDLPKLDKKWRIK